MSKAVITIALGAREWGDRCLNLCLSAKANDENVQVGLLCDANAIKGIEPLIDQHFDKKNLLLNATNPRREAFNLKTNLYLTAQYMFPDADQFIFMDADAIMMPGKKVSDWFAELGNEEIAFYTNDIWDYTTRKQSRTGHSFFCDINKAIEYFNLTRNLARCNAFIPQVDAAWIYWRKSYLARFIFEIAADVYVDAEFEYEKYRGEKLAEMCFNIALSKMGTWPCAIGKQTFRPVFLEAFSGLASVEFLQHQYKAFGFAGVNAPSPALQAYYNKLSQYYRDYFGVIPKFMLMNPRETVAGYKTYGFWHICLINHWEAIVKEQLKDLVKSGLYDKSSAIYVGITGEQDEKFKFDKELLKGIIQAYPKIKIATVKNIGLYEFPTLELIEQKANEINEQPFLGWYIHTKGVSNKKGDYWRKYLNYYNIIKWKECQDKLSEGYDLCGVKLLNAGANHPQHYSGNFFHFNSNYIKQLPKINTLDRTDRFQAEMWVCTAAPNAATLCQKMIDQFNKEPFK